MASTAPGRRLRRDPLEGPGHLSDRARLVAIIRCVILLVAAALLVTALATGQAAARLKSHVSAEQAVQTALDRIEALDPKVGAVIATDPAAIETAREMDARAANDNAPLYGMPILVKDNIETAGSLPTTAGSLALVQNVSGRDAPVVARLRAAGAIILGKTNLSEWANFRSEHSVSGWSAVGGLTRNPHALNRNACGSSSGSAVAVAAGMVPAAVGTETDGSITCPAAMTGIVGLKPTVGLVSRSRIVPISSSQDTAGPMARTVQDAARLLNAMAGSDPGDPATAAADGKRVDYPRHLDPDALRGARIGVLRFATGSSPATDEVFEQALTVLRGKDAVLVDVDFEPDRTAIGDLEFKVLLSEFRAGANAYLASTPAAVQVRSLEQLIAFDSERAVAEMPLFGQDILLQAKAAPALSDPEYRKARAESQRLAGPDGIDRMLAAHKLVALVAPTAAPAFLIDPVNGDQLAGGGAGYLAAVAGYPHLTVPMGTVHRLPVGLSFIGPAWSEARLLSLGYAFEQATHARVEPRFLDNVAAEADIAAAFEPGAASVVQAR